MDPLNAAEQAACLDLASLGLSWSCCDGTCRPDSSVLGGFTPCGIGARHSWCSAPARRGFGFVRALQSTGCARITFPNDFEEVRSLGSLRELSRGGTLSRSALRSAFRTRQRTGVVGDGPKMRIANTFLWSHTKLQGLRFGATACQIHDISTISRRFRPRETRHSRRLRSAQECSVARSSMRPSSRRRVVHSSQRSLLVPQPGSLPARLWEPPRGRREHSRKTLRRNQHQQPSQPQPQQPSLPLNQRPHKLNQLRKRRQLKKPRLPQLPRRSKQRALRRLQPRRLAVSTALVRQPAKQWATATGRRRSTFGRPS